MLLETLLPWADRICFVFKASPHLNPLHLIGPTGSPHSFPSLYLTASRDHLLPTALLSLRMPLPISCRAVHALSTDSGPPIFELPLQSPTAIMIYITQSSLREIASVFCYLTWGCLVSPTRLRAQITWVTSWSPISTCRWMAETEIFVSFFYNRSQNINIALSNPGEIN